MNPLIILLIVVAVIIAFVVATYNKLVTLRNRVKEAWSDIDVQLKRRYNLIPNIVETVKGYATHEEKVLTQVTEARSNAINATNVQEQGAAENMLSGALKSLFAVAENYPDLKANENFMQLQNELVDTEDKIQASRRFYNGVVRDFNTKIEMFPSNIIAGMFKFEKSEFFEIEDEEQRENVKVSFDKTKEKVEVKAIKKDETAAEVIGASEKKEEKVEASKAEPKKEPKEAEKGGGEAPEKEDSEAKELEKKEEDKA